MRIAITRDQHDAVLLDLDGVITDTANMHAACWKQIRIRAKDAGQLRQQSMKVCRCRYWQLRYTNASLREAKQLSKTSWFPPCALVSVVTWKS